MMTKKGEMQLTVKQRYQQVINQALAGDGNVVKAAQQVGYSAGGAAKLAQNPQFIQMWKAQQEEFFQRNLCTKNEILSFLALTMRGQILDTMGLDPSLADRIKAAELLGKAANLWSVNNGREVDLSSVVADARRRVQSRQGNDSHPASPSDDS